MQQLPFVVLFLASSLYAQHSIAVTHGTTANGELGRVVRAAGDLDGDGTGDFAVVEPGFANNGRVHVISGTSRLPLVTFLGDGSGGYVGLGYDDVSPVGDVDADGRGDFAIGYNQHGVIDVFSGNTGARLYRLGPAVQHFQYAAAVGDLNADLHADFAVFVVVSGSLHLRIISGDGGGEIATGLVATNWGRLLSLGDIEGDNRVELALNRGTAIDVLGLDPPRLLRTITRPNGAGMFVDADVADLAGDSRNEICAVESGARAFVFAPQTGALVRTLELRLAGTSVNTTHLAMVGDLDADGVPDLARHDNGPSTVFAYPRVHFQSGRDGHVLSVWVGSAALRLGEGALASPGDLDGDGYRELVIGDFSANQWSGAWQVVSPRILATMQFQPANCAQGPFLPQLGMTRPVLGQTVVFVGRDAPPSVAGFLALSAQPVTAINLGAVGCDAWFDITNWAALHQPASGGGWSFTVPLPNAPQLAGLQVAAQAFYAPTNGPLGYDLSNGVWARIGY